MTTYEVIIKLCKEKRIAVTALERELGFGRGSIGKLRNGNTTSDRLQKIADYFGVAVDYLMTGEEKENSEKYYINDETAAMAQKLFENKELRVLFDAASDASPEDLKTTHDMLLALKRKERGYEDDTGC